MRRLATLLLALAIGLAGCLAAEDAPADAPAPGEVVVDEARPEPSFNDIPDADLGVKAEPDAAATLDAPPRLVPGEWWRIRFTTDLPGGEDVEFVRVVARANEDGSYVVGMPHEGWYKEAVIYHTPAFGDVNADLSYHAHDVPFVPLKFPLTDGATWETHWENGNIPLTATVKVVDERRAEVSFVGPQCGVQALLGPCPEGSPVAERVRLTYDASIHEVSKLEILVGGQTAYEVVEHGYGFQGWVTVPRGEDLVFFHGRIGAPVVDLGLQPAPPLETVPVSGGFNRVTFILGAGNLGGLAGAAYGITATSPDGTPYALQMAPAESFRVEFFEHADPDGDWQLEYVAAGGGYAFIEGIAYHQYDIHLPSGSVRSDHPHEVVR